MSEPWKKGDRARIKTAGRFRSIVVELRDQNFHDEWFCLPVACYPVPNDPGEPRWCGHWVAASDLERTAVSQPTPDVKPSPAPSPTVADVLAGIGRWLADAPDNRSATVKTEGHGVEVVVTSQPTLAHCRVKFATPDHAANVVNTLDHAIMHGADHPTREIAITSDRGTMSVDPDVRTGRADCNA